MSLSPENAGKNVQSISRCSYIGPLSMIHMQFWPNNLSFGSFKVISGQIRFLPLTFDRIEIVSWEWSQPVFFSQRRIDWYAIWPTLHNKWRHVTLTWGQVLTLTFLGQHVHISKRSDERKTMVPKLCLNLKKKRFFYLSWPLYLNPLKLHQFWCHVSVRTVKELSSAFSRGFLPIIINEIMSHLRRNVKLR